MKQFTPTLYFGGRHYGRAAAAAQRYAAVLPLTEIVTLQVLPDDMCRPGAVHRINAVLGGRPFLLVDDTMTQPSEAAPLLMTVICDNAEEYDRLKTELCPLGELGYPMREDDEMLWSVFDDDYGVSWELICAAGSGGSERKAATVQRLTPTLYFSGSHYGQAQAAVTSYIGLVPLAQIIRIRHFGRQQTTADGFVPKMIEFQLGGLSYRAIDDHGRQAQADAAFTFAAQCSDAAEFDRLYDALVDPESVDDMRYDRSAGQWARFTDRFGIRWELSGPQELPTVLR